MRTLKKTLCLVLCLAMMVGLCAVAASAAFEDADEIVYKEAVDVMTGIGVIKGVGDGSKFAPADTLNRASACAIITRMLQMDDIKATAPFEDCVGHWGESEIAYCAAEGIVNGKGDGTFGPDELLTGAAWAKMVLVALGYDAEENGMTGDSWDIGVAKLLKKVGLAATIKGFVASEPISRDEACELAFNALQYSENEDAGYAVWNDLDSDGILDAGEPVIGYQPTLLDAAIAANALGSAYKYQAAKTVFSTDAMTADFQLKQLAGTQGGIGVQGYAWYIDNNKNGAYDQAVDTVVSDFITTDTVIGTFTKANTFKDISTALGKKADYVVDGYLNGAPWFTGTTIDWDNVVPGTLVADSSMTVTVVKTVTGAINFLYEQEVLCDVARGAKVTAPTDPNFGKYPWNFTATVGGAAVKTVYGAEDAYNANAKYLVVNTAVPTITLCTPVVGVISAMATDKYVKANGVQYNLANADVDNSLSLDAIADALYRNTAGDLVYIGVPGVVATVYDGYVYVTASEYVATPGTQTGVLNAATDATITAKATIVTDAGEAKTVNLNTKFVPAVPGVSPSANQIWDGSAYAAVIPDGTVKSGVFAAGWYAYTAEADGSYKLYALPTKALAGVTAKQAAITVDGNAGFMTKDTVIKTVNFNRNAVTTSTLTGYTSIVDASVLNGKNAIVVADANGVISSITIYSATAPVVAASYAVYAGLGELDGVKGQYYNFYVNGEIVSFLANDTTVASAITGLTAPKVATYVAAGEKITTITDKGAGAAATVTILADGYIVNGSTVIYTAPNMVVVDGTATGNYAVTSLAKGDTITYYAGAAGIEFAIVTAHAA